MIAFEQEVCKYLGLPSIPKREWDGETMFEKGVAIIETKEGKQCYCACTCRVLSNGHCAAEVSKVFCLEPFVKIISVFVVPNYMSTIDDVAEMDLDEASKKKVEQMLQEAAELSGENGEEDNTPKIEDLPEWIFPEIKSKDEAQAWLRQYNKSNKIRANRVPSSEETLKLRLYSIYMEQYNKTK